MKKWYNLAFVALCILVLTVLLNAPDIKTPRTPDNPTHVNPKVFAGCPTCHMPGGEGPEMRADHISKDGTLKLDHPKCYMCHKPVEK
jgi:hypothetical protein